MFVRDVIGNIKYGTRKIGVIIWNTFTLILLNMGMCLHLA